MSINTIFQGNAWDLVNEIEDDSLDLIFTSPPYYRLRNYFVDDVIIGDNACEHDFNEFYIKHDCGKTQLNNKEDGNFEKRNIWERNNFVCKKCGAFKGQFGLEPHPKLYIENLVSLFDLLKPKLKKSGNLIVNLGDTFAGSNGKSCEKNDVKNRKETFKPSEKLKEDIYMFDEFFKPKQKLLIPHRFAIAMQDNGWYCRGDWVWSKPNGIPSSADDRLTVKKEFVFHFTKHKDYYFDLNSIKIPCKPLNRWGGNVINIPEKTNNNQSGMNARKRNLQADDLLKNPGDVLEFNTKSSGDEHFAIMTDSVAEFALKCCCPENGIVLDPFMGTGTTGVVAKKQNKNYVGFELSPKYIEIANKRLDSIKKISDTYIVEENINQQFLF